MSKRLSVDPIAEAKRQWTEHGWSDAAAGMTTVTSIIRGQQLMLARVEGTLRPFGLSFARFELLRLLAFSREGVLPLASAIAADSDPVTKPSRCLAGNEREGMAFWPTTVAPMTS